jgi:putative transposase
VLREVEDGEKVAEICRRLGISEQTFYTWKQKYSGMGLSGLREYANSLSHPRRSEISLGQYNIHSGGTE